MIYKSVILGFLVHAPLALAEQSSLVPKDAVTLRTYGVERHFFGFSYTRDPGEQDRLEIRLLPDADHSSLEGVWVKTDEKGEIREIGPILGKKGEEISHFAWAMEKFESGRLSIDALWEVLRADMDSKMPDEALFRFLIETISTSSKRPDLGKLMIGPNSECWMAFKAVDPEADGPRSLGEIIEHLNNQ